MQDLRRRRASKARGGCHLICNPPLLVRRSHGEVHDICMDHEPLGLPNTKHRGIKPQPFVIEDLQILNDALLARATNKTGHIDSVHRPLLNYPHHIRHTYRGRWASHWFTSHDMVVRMKETSRIPTSFYVATFNQKIPTYTKNVGHTSPSIPFCLNNMHNMLFARCPQQCLFSRFVRVVKKQRSHHRKIPIPWHHICRIWHSSQNY